MLEPQPEVAEGAAHAVAAGHTAPDWFGAETWPAGTVDAVPHGRGMFPGWHFARGNFDLSGRRRVGAVTCKTGGPPRLIGAVLSTSYVERQNLSMRMTNGFSKKLENHVAANALYFLHYNFARIHRTLRVTPAMAAGIADHVWSIEEIVGLLDTHAKQAA